MSSILNVLCEAFDVTIKAQIAKLNEDSGSILNQLPRPAVADETAEVLRSAVQKLSNTMAAFNRELNLRSPQGRLPDEMFSRIFEYHVEGLIEDHEYINDQFEWRNILSVCSRWRSIAMNTPSIWSNINLAWGIPLVEQHMCLAVNAPLHFTLRDGAELSTEQVDAFAEMIPLNRHRVAGINIEWDVETCPLRDFYSIILSTLSGSYPMLKTLVLSSEAVHTAFPLQDSEFRNLQVLHLQNFRLPPTIWLQCPRLKSFTLEAEFALEHPQPILDLLTQHPLLEELDLCGLAFTQWRGPALTVNMDPIRMPYLRRLRLFKISHPALRWLLDMLDLPSSVEFDFELRLVSFDNVVPESFSATVLSRMRAATWLNLELPSQYHTIFTFGCSESQSDRISLRGETCDVAAFPFEALQALFIEVDPSLTTLTAETWSRIFEEWDQINDLTIRTDNVSPCLTALVIPDAAEPSATPTTAVEEHPCPSLRDLDIKKCKYDPSLLLRLLKQRHDAQIALENLHFTQYSSRHELAPFVKEIVYENAFQDLELDEGSEPDADADGNRMDWTLNDFLEYDVGNSEYEPSESVSGSETDSDSDPYTTDPESSEDGEDENENEDA
ncbi:hypothetical protein SISNIDRAFT_459069 [Sistotremastrum niveocremeum HHB9708]|uniref:F-box domain-containing protein n=1 Tax=Sistotremastrum niveocremeum HHB9708 TaxID=1314777 RepID=A0A164PWE9_9AGAM|nr:hypothetical protein SISNIDRAFT_459069 [Sistotremastrum niveocremeum HHB9708]